MRPTILAWRWSARAPWDGYEPGRAYDVICLDIDNGLQWTVTDHNRVPYDHAELIGLPRRLADGGVLATWSASGPGPSRPGYAGISPPSMSARCPRLAASRTRSMSVRAWTNSGASIGPVQ
jgi:hypothetical protein